MPVGVLCVHGTHMNGISQYHAWNAPVPRMEYACIMHGIHMEYACTMHRVPLYHAWNTLVPRMEYTWNMQVSCMKFSFRHFILSREYIYLWLHPVTINACIVNSSFGCFKVGWVRSMAGPKSTQIRFVGIITSAIHTYACFSCLSYA